MFEMEKIPFFSPLDMWIYIYIYIYIPSVKAPVVYGSILFIRGACIFKNKTHYVTKLISTKLIFIKGSIMYGCELKSSTSEEPN
jgi:hypothetical protein